MQAVDFLTCGLLAIPHILYAIIWYYPELWRRTFGRDSVDIFAKVATALKVVQFASVAVWWWLKNNGELGFKASEISAPRTFISAILVVLGQVLNVSIYQAIGAVGVYYGFKLGHTVPWHTGFPFNVVSHPQYVGSVLTIWGLGYLLWPQAPSGFSIILIFWTGLYVATAVQEQS